MENRAQLKDVSVAEVLEDIQGSAKTDLIVAPEEVRLFGMGGTRIGARFADREVPVNPVAQSQIESSMMAGFSTYGRNLASAGMMDLYVENANRLLPEIKKNRFIRLQQRPEKENLMRAWLSASYQRYDDDMVFGSLIDAVTSNPAASEFRSIGGYRTDERTYLKLVTKDPLFSINADGRERSFSPGFILSNSEVGMGFCKIEVLLIDRYCTNGCIFSSASVGEFRVMHRGKNFSDAVSGSLVDALAEGNRISTDKMQKAIMTAVSAAFNKDLYLGYREAMTAAATIRIDDDNRAVELFAKHIGKAIALSEAEQKAVAQRMLETGDRSLFGVQAALTDAAKYAGNYDRKLELERAGGKIFTEVPKRWKTIQALVESEKNAPLD